MQTKTKNSRTYAQLVWQKRWKIFKERLSMYASTFGLIILFGLIWVLYGFQWVIAAFFGTFILSFFIYVIAEQISEFYEEAGHLIADDAQALINAYYEDRNPYYINVPLAIYDLEHIKLRAGCCLDRRTYLMLSEAIKKAESDLAEQR